MRLKDLLSRADDETLQSLLGEAPMKLILSLDASLATPQQLHNLITRIYSPEGLLLSPDKRSILFDILPKSQALMLHQILELGNSENAYTSLKKASIRRGSKREKALFDFFGLNIPVREVEDEKPPKQSLSGNYALFAHQRTAAQEIRSALSEPPRRVVLHMPTGAGKTRSAMNIIADHLRLNEPTLVIWLAHTEELCEQSASEFEKAWSHLGNRPVAVHRFWGSHELSLDDVNDGILIAGLAKMYSAAKKRIAFIRTLASRTSLVVMDEAHSAIAETYKLILDALVVTQRPNPALLGLTATPGRTWADITVDEQLSKFFARRKVALHIDGYENPVDYLVDQQYLARVIYQPLFYEGSVLLSQSDINKLQSHFDIPDSILKLFADDEMRNLAIINAIENLTKRHRRIIVFATTAKHSSVLAAVLQMRGYDAASVTGDTPTVRRSQVINHFKQDTQDARILCNYGVLTTGFDAPLTSAAVIARPTKSLVLYSQMVGRAIRGKRAGGNETAEIISVVDSNLPGFGSVAEAFNNWEDIWE